MESTKDKCGQTAEGAGEVAQSLDVMTDFVTEINDLSTQIATAAEEQSSVTQELSRNMSAINDIVGELDSNGQQALEEAHSIPDINTHLASIVSRFKLSGIKRIQGRALLIEGLFFFYFNPPEKLQIWGSIFVCHVLIKRRTPFDWLAHKEDKEKPSQ